MEGDSDMERRVGKIKEKEATGRADRMSFTIGIFRKPYRLIARYQKHNGVKEERIGPLIPAIKYTGIIIVLPFVKPH